MQLTYAADSDCELDDAAAWAAANPSIEHLSYLRPSIEIEAEVAMGDPDAARQFRRYRLNHGPAVAGEGALVDVADWRAREVTELPPRAGYYALGIDFGGSASMTAAAA